MKKLAVNILCSTGITLLVLATIATLFGAKYLFISSVFQSFLVNIILHFGFLLTHKLESNYAILEYAVDIGYTIALVLISGYLFNWYCNMTVWMLVIMSILIYLIGILLSAIQMHHHVEEINELLQKRNYK